MKTRLLVAGAIAAVLVGAACSKSSTGPSDPFVGTWKITFATVPASMSFSPMPWSITVSKSGTIYYAAYPDLVWSYTSPPSQIDTYYPTAPLSGIAIRNDSLLLVTQDPLAQACTLTVAGAVTGNSASGIATAGGNMCVPGSWPWTATKQ